MSPYYVGVVDPEDGTAHLDPNAPSDRAAPLCWKRQQTINVDRNLALVLAFEDHCIAFGKQDSRQSNKTSAVPGKKSPSPATGKGGKSSTSPSGRSNGKNGKTSSDYDHYLHRVTSLTSDELTVTLMASLDDVTATALKQIPCIGCRTALSDLKRNVNDAAGALEPLVVTGADMGTRENPSEGGTEWLAVNRHHLMMPGAIARLFTDELARLDTDFNDNILRPAQRARSVGTFRCHIHSSKKHPFSDRVWRDQWDGMAPNCREAVLTIPYEKLKGTVETYLRKHRFCHECTNMVFQALYLLTGENSKDPSKCYKHQDSQPALEHSHTPPPASCGDSSSHESSPFSCASEEDPDQCCSTNRNKCCCCNGPAPAKRNTIYDGLTGDKEDRVVRVRVDHALVEQLIEMAVPEINGDQTEKHAKTLEIAQKEVCICVGMALYTRFRDCQLSMREGVQTVDLMLLMALKTLKYQLDLAYEEKVGGGGLRSVDMLVEEFAREEEDGIRKKQLKREKKSEKKAKQKAKKKQLLCKENVSPSPPGRDSESPARKCQEYDFSKRLDLIDLFESASPESEDDLRVEEAIPPECIEEYQRNLEQVKRKIEEIHCRLEQDWKDKMMNKNNVRMNGGGQRSEGNNMLLSSRRR